MKKQIAILFVSILLMFLNGCNTEGLDFKKLSKETDISPEFVIPIAKANISVWDLVQSANTKGKVVIQKDPDGLIKIVYQQSDLIEYRVKDLIDFPDKQRFSTGPKEVGDIFANDISVSAKITLSALAGQLNGALDGIIPFNGMNIPFPPISVSGQDAHFNLETIPDYTIITLSKGTLEITLENELKVPLSLEGSLFDRGNNREMKDFTFTDMTPQGMKTISIDLAGVELSNQIEFRLKTFNTPGSSTPVHIDMKDYFKIGFKLKDLEVSKGHLMVSKSQSLKGAEGTFTFVFPDPDLKVYSAEIKKGSISFITGNTTQLTGTVNFKLNEIKKDGVPMEIKVPLNGNSSTIDLSGVVINFNSDQNLPFNHLPFVYSLLIDSKEGFIDFSSTDEVKIDVTLDDIEFKSITGDIGKRSIMIDPGSFNVKLDLLNKLKGSFNLANPSIELTIHNTIGIPGSLKLEFIAESKDGLLAPLNPPTFDIPVPTGIEVGMATKQVVFDKSNSQIVNFIGLPPTGKIMYSGQVDFNKTGEVTVQNPNFMDIDALFGIGWLMELPLELQVKSLGYEDTTSISGSDFTNFDSADLIINATNGIPLDFDLQLLFIDTISKQANGVSQVEQILSAAQVDASGGITPTQSSHTFSLSKADLENLRKSNGLVFSTSVSSPASGTTIARLYSDREIKLNVIIKSKVNL